jgi:membrane protease subunit (stomatin/prohibitin family)
MLRRRRPVLRAATMAGGAALAYHAGKNVQGGRDQNAAQDEQISQMQQQQQAPAAPAAPAAGGISQDAMAKLQQLGQLHEQGVLTDEEFAAQKAKVLG